MVRQIESLPIDQISKERPERVGSTDHPSIAICETLPYNTATVDARVRVRIVTATALSIVLLCGLLVRIPYLETRSLWFDEASSWQTSRFSLARQISSLRDSTHMPLYYPLLDGWCFLFGDSATALRGFSVGFGVLTIVGMYLLATEIRIPRPRSPNPADRRDSHGGAGMKATPVPWLAVGCAALCAASAFQVHASVEARMYSMGTALIAFSSWLVLRLAHGERTARCWSGLTFLSACSLYTHNMLLFSVVIQFGYLAVVGVLDHRASRMSGGSSFFGRWIACALVTAVVWIPGALLLRQQYARVHEGFWIPPMDMTSVPRAFLHFVLPVDQVFDEAFGVVAVCTTVCIGLVVVASLIRANRDVWFLVGMFAVPVIAVGLLSIQTSLWESRYFRFAQLFLLPLLLVFIVRLPRLSRQLRLALSVLLILGSFAGTGCFWHFRDIPRRPGMRGAISAIQRERWSDDLILATEDLHYFVAKYYARRSGIPQDRVQFLAPHGGGGLDTRHLLQKEDFLDARQISRELHRGVWVIGDVDRLLRQVRPAADIEIQKWPAFEFDYGAPQWPVSVCYCRRRRE